MVIGRKARQSRCSKGVAEITCNGSELKDWPPPESRSLSRQKAERVLEVFEWKSKKRLSQLLTNSTVQAMWKEYSEVCDYVPIASVEEAKQLFFGIYAAKFQRQRIANKSFQRTGQREPAAGLALAAKLSLDHRRKMKVFANQRFLTVYSGVITLVFVVTALSGFSSVTKLTTFDEINVRRINVA